MEILKTLKIVQHDFNDFSFSDLILSEVLVLWNSCD